MVIVIGTMVEHVHQTLHRLHHAKDFNVKANLNVNCFFNN